MLQPFERFQASYIESLKNLKKIYIVTQSYSRGVANPDGRHLVNILFSTYDDPGLAKIHLNAIKRDRFAYILDLNNEKHSGKVKEMLHPDSVYAVYWSVVRDTNEIKKTLDRAYKDNFRRYITSNTNWRISADETIKPSLQVIFGELYIVLKRGAQSIRVKFEAIEKS